MSARTVSKDIRVHVASSGGAGGASWAFALRRAGRVIARQSGHDPEATPYRAELLAVVAGLEALPAEAATIICANQNIILTATDWMHAWRARGWRKKKGNIEHLDLVKTLWALNDRLALTWLRADPADPACEDVRSEAKAKQQTESLGVTKQRAGSLDKPAVELSRPGVLVADTSKRLVAYTDGGCRGNPGPGGWGFLLIDTVTGAGLERRGGNPSTTNNRMEMQAAIEVLRSLKKPGQQIEIRTDSSYLINLSTKWMAGWKRRGWKRGGGAVVKNVDLVQEVDVLMARHHVSWCKVPGHAGEPGNEFADRLTNEAMDDVQLGRDGSLTVRHPQSPVQVRNAGEGPQRH